MIEHFETQAEAKLRRNEILDSCLHTQGKDFEARYTHLSFENACRYRAAVYDAVDTVEAFPADIEWPEEPEYEKKSAFDAALRAAMGSPVEGQP